MCIKWYHLAVFFSAVLFIVIIRVIPWEQKTFHTCIVYDAGEIVDQFDYCTHEMKTQSICFYDQEGFLIREVFRKSEAGRIIEIYQKGD